MNSDPWVASDCWYAACDGRVSLNGPNVVPEGLVHFCKIDDVLQFFERLRLTRRRIILVTGEGDIPCDEFRQRFMPANVIRWFATNVTHSHPRVTALPLGLGSAQDSVTMSGDQLSEGRKQGLEREKWLYVNFRSETNPSIRQPIFDYFESLSRTEEWITLESPLFQGGKKGFLHNLLTHKFVLCPPGNGVDTHRMWESLAAGAIPIVLRSHVVEPFKGMPILRVDSYEEVTKELLKETACRITPTKSEDPMLRASFWMSQIQAAKQAAIGNETMSFMEWMRESIRYGSDMVKRRIFIQ